MNALPWSTICLIVSAILILISGLLGEPKPDGPYYRRGALFVFGVFFFVVAFLLR